MLILLVAVLLGVHDPHHCPALVEDLPRAGTFSNLSLYSRIDISRPFQDPVQPPMLLSLALPHLPAPLPSVIINGMKYMQIGSVFFDDIAVLLFGVGFIIWLASWFAG